MTDQCYDGSLGDPCIFDSDCMGSLVCRNYVCSDGTEGANCTFDSDCQPGLYCDALSSICYDGSPGDPCSLNSDCQSNDCTFPASVCA